MVVAAVDQSQLHRRPFKPHRRAQAAKAAANDHHMVLTRHDLRSSLVSSYTLIWLTESLRPAYSFLTLQGLPYTHGWAAIFAKGIGFEQEN